MFLNLRFCFAGGLWAVGLQWEEGQTEPPPAADDAGEAPEEEYDGEEPYAEEEAAAGGGGDAGVEEAKSSSPAEEEGEEDNGGNSNSNSNNNSNANSGMFAVDHQLGNTATKGRRKSTKKEEPQVLSRLIASRIEPEVSMVKPIYEVGDFIWAYFEVRFLRPSDVY